VPAIYFFEVIWEVACLRKGAWQTGQCILRSAVREFSDSLFLVGPNLLEVKDPYVRPDLKRLISWAEKNASIDLSSSGYRTLPGEPRIMVASHGQRIRKGQTLYELWEDSGLHLLSAELFFIEPLIFCHAFKALLNHTRDELFSGTPADTREYDCLTARAHLCVKEKSQRIQTVLSSEARITGKSGMTFGMDLYGDLHHTYTPELKARYALLVPDAGEQRERPLSTGHIPADLRTKADVGGNPGLTVRTPGEPERDYLVLPVTSERKQPGGLAPPSLASGFLAHMTFYEEPSGLLWIF